MTTAAAKTNVNTSMKKRPTATVNMMVMMETEMRFALKMAMKRNMEMNIKTRPEIEGGEELETKMQWI